MSKDKYVVEDNILSNLKGFIRKGASSNVQGYVPTGHFILDFVINYGDTPDNIDLTSIKGYDPSNNLGLPLGKIVEIYGEEGAGKSSLAYRVIGSAQKMGLPCAWIDTENSFSDSLSLINGVNKDELYYSDMSNEADADKFFYAEDVFDAIISLSKSGIKVIVLDSVADLVPKARMEKNAGEMTVGIIAKLMSENLGKIINYASTYGVLVIFINQLREKIGVLYGSNETTPGGRSLKFNASIRLRVGKKSGKEADITVEEENGKERLIGRKAYVRIVKNRFAKPYFESMEIPIFYEAYFPDIEETMFDEGRRLQLIRVRKGEFKWIDVSEKEWAAEGKKAFIQLIKNNNLQNSLTSEIDNKAKEASCLLPPEISQWISDNKKTLKADTVGATENEKEISGRRKRKNSSDGKQNAEG
jgi:protein RecA